MGDAQVRELLRETVKRAGGVRAWARQNSVSPPFVSAVLRGQRPVSAKLLNALGFEKVIDYRLKKEMP